MVTDTAPKGGCAPTLFTQCRIPTSETTSRQLGEQTLVLGGSDPLGYMVSIPGAIPPSRDTPSSTPPPTTVLTSRRRVMRWLPGVVFSAKMMSAAVSMQAKFISPRATNPTISPAQQP
jgi:hypothetical protein